MNGRLELPPLYPIVNVADDAPASLALALELATTLSAAGVTLIQLRAKTLAAGAMTELAAKVVRAIAAHGGRLIVNDRADVAAAAGAAGVHVGDEDITVVAARKTVGDDAIVGYSTHSLDDIAAAAALDADYVGFGPIFESPTKIGVRSPRGLSALREACSASPHPVVAIGGVTLASAPELWHAGAASVAVISEIERAPDPGALVRRYVAAWGARASRPAR